MNNYYFEVAGQYWQQWYPDNLTDKDWFQNKVAELLKHNPSLSIAGAAKIAREEYKAKLAVI